MYNFLERILPTNNKKETCEENKSNDFLEPPKPKSGEKPIKNEPNNFPVKENEDILPISPSNENPSVPASPVEKNNKNNYRNWTYQQIVSEIKKIKVEIEQLKADKTINSLEKQAELTEKLERVKFDIKQNQQPNLDNNFPTGLVIGRVAVGLVATVLVGVTIKRIKSRKSSFSGAN
ncbi:MAG: hypothetical protein I3273_01330 [Candidatus Moeniiplasma glomeromycotorum]|nr:hypothetical protein [Candidatus Moeniiplasma glomeromycotorum]MCE8167236.1 hypothetical protein [Candidatus Moeniiplasma glomeromycotorum]MCE8168751.1 hypothetical protein [Candidatus Moeniiplasma glomeromycotorum]